MVVWSNQRPADPLPQPQETVAFRPQCLPLPTWKGEPTYQEKHNLDSTPETQHPICNSRSQINIFCVIVISLKYCNIVISAHTSYLGEMLK